MKSTFYLCLAAAAFAFVGPVLAAEAEKPQPPQQLERMSREVARLVKKYYPDAKVSVARNEKTGAETIHFEFSAYPILMRYRNKDGSWQKPVEVRGPYVGGIWCDMTLAKGRYEGDVADAEKGVTEMGPDFYSRLVAPYSKQRDKSMTVKLRFPGGTPREFLKAFDELVQGFEQYLPEPGPKHPEAGEPTTTAPSATEQ